MGKTAGLSLTNAHLATATAKRLTWQQQRPILSSGYGVTLEETNPLLSGSLITSDTSCLDKDISS